MDEGRRIVEKLSAAARGEDPERPGGAAPARYYVRQTDAGKRLLCRDAPGIVVIVDRSLSFSEADARKLGSRAILLDGVGSFGPLLDNENQLYNLDHHQDCVRSFTLSTCEQALVLVLKGLELDRADWTIYANEPDLDTVFALWVLLNHRRIESLDTATRDVLLPLVRLEGAIDANGRQIAEFCGLPQATLEHARQTLEELFDLERRTKGADTDLFEFTAHMLAEIDGLVYSEQDLGEQGDIEEEYGHVDIGDGKVAVACRDSTGIYEVEKLLKSRWGERLGVIALENSPKTYTLRRISSLARIDLAAAYARLNVLDPAVDGRPPEKRWGGSDDIGGSPRPGGSLLTPKELLQILEQTYQPVGARQKLGHLARALLFAPLLLLAGGAAALQWGALPFLPEGSAALGAGRLGVLSGALWLGSALLTALYAGRRYWLYGWRRPAGRAWLGLAPLVIVGGVLGAAWVPRPLGDSLPLLGAWVGAALLAGLATEACFRGLLHGLLMLDGRVQGVEGPWRLTRAGLISAFLYAGATWVLSASWIAPSPTGLAGALPGGALVLVGALISGLALSVLRERSLSLWPGVAAQWLAALAVLGLTMGLS